MPPPPLTVFRQPTTKPRTLYSSLKVRSGHSREVNTSVPETRRARELRISTPGTPHERHIRISKTLTQLLRHTAVDFNIDVHPDGFCPLQQLLECPLLRGATGIDVGNIVATDVKKCFEMSSKDGELMIRAVQGHSMSVVDDNRLLQTITPYNVPDCCVHGTYKEHFESVKAHGLSPGGHQGQTSRRHVHFSSFNPGDQRVISGMRASCQIAIWIDVKKAVEAGVPFYLSRNGVIVSPAIVLPKYFSSAMDLTTMETLSLDSTMATALALAVWRRMRENLAAWKDCGIAEQSISM